MSAAALASLSPLFLWTEYWSIAIGVLYLVAVGEIVIGLRRREFLSNALGVVAVAVAAQIGLFTCWAGRFLHGF